MASDPIREALAAATRAGCACDCKAPQPGCVQTVADEVAAFLRALPDESGMNIAAPDCRDEWFGCEELAAAVEAAAREGE